MLSISHHRNVNSNHNATTHALEWLKEKRRITPSIVVNMEQMKTSTNLQTLKQFIIKLNMQLHDSAIALIDIYQEK